MKEIKLFIYSTNLSLAMIDSFSPVAGVLIIDAIWFMFVKNMIDTDIHI